MKVTDKQEHKPEQEHEWNMDEAFEAPSSGSAMTSGKVKNVDLSKIIVFFGDVKIDQAC